ncbi:MAG TPA: hypothetical protein ENI98_13150 [Gammaproteobacteria bacterium]|nr:hypothetical protein [Gammaproteobacteria bacterium]
MICYLEYVTEVEISVINDYWRVSDETTIEFFYTLKQINDHYKSKKVRPVSFLAKKSNYLAPHPAFTCQDCNRKIPVKNRKEYTNRMKCEEAMFCSNCSDLRRQHLIENARRTLAKYKAEKFVPTAYLNSLTIEELLALLSITAEQAENNVFLGVSPVEVTITGVQLIDQKIIQSLIDKKALVYIPEIPLEVERASHVIYGSFRHITYENRYKNSVQYRPSESISPGVFINPLALDGGEEISDISQILYQKLQSFILSVDGVTKIHQIIKEIQIGKLYELVNDIGKEYKVAIDNSNVLRGLLDHLAENYSPMKIYFTFRVKARDTIEYMHKESISGYRSKYYFTKFVSNYIQYIEDNGFVLKKSWTLPPHLHVSPFEALFSQLYLNEHFDWNRLSAKEVVALWLENVHLEVDTQELLT